MTEHSSVGGGNERGRGFFAFVERTGNALPDPVFIFIALTVILIAVSYLVSVFGLSVDHPITGRAITAVSLLSADNVSRLLTEMPATFSRYQPLGLVLVVMMGAGVAEKSGLLGATMRAALHDVRRTLLTPVIVAVGMLGSLAGDAAFVVLVPMSAVVFAAAGRHPLVGLAASFAAVAGGFSANLVPGQVDALLFGITQAAADIIQPGWQPNIAGNWYIIAAAFLTKLPIIWFITDRIMEPKFGAWAAGADVGQLAGAERVTDTEKSALRRAGLAALGIVLLWIFLTIGPGQALIDKEAVGEARFNPLFQSLVPGFLFLFLVPAWVYGARAGTIKSHRDVVRYMSSAMSDMGYFLVLAFAAAQFITLFSWSNLGVILAINGASFVQSINMPVPITLASVVVVTGFINLFVGSASAKWALLSPILVPQLMLLGISPEMATAAYRMGDSPSNVMSPLFVYFPLMLVFCQRWITGFGLGSLLAIMIPYGVALLLAGMVLAVGFAVLDLPLGPGASVQYSLQ